MKWFKNFLLKAILIYGFSLLLEFLFFRVLLINTSPIIVVFSVLLLLAELHNLSQFFTMLYSLWPRHYQQYKTLYANKTAQINMFICVCGEPTEIVRETIVAAKRAALQYVQTIGSQHLPQVIVLNDGYAAKKENAYEIELLAKELQVKHVARSVSTGYKAGNLNNGFKTIPTKDAQNTFDIVLDADFAVVPEFLTEITRPFIDDSVDFVQTPQRYKNENTWVAQAAAAHQVHFFKHVCPAKAYDNGLFLCGTNFAIRRSALDSVGGMDERFITEDYATSLNLHLNGKKGVFINKPLAYGIAPSSLKAYFSQQQRWSKGTFDTSLVYLKNIVFGPLTLRQKFQYLISSIYYLSGLRNLIYMLAPLPYLFFGVSLIQTNLAGFFLLIYGPLFLYNFIVYFLLFDHPLKSWVLDTISFPVFIAAFFSSVLKKNLAFIVTIKKYQKENIFHVYKLQLFVVLLLTAGLIASVMLHHLAYSLGEYLNYFWVMFNIFVLSLGFYLFLKDNYVNHVDLGTGRFKVKAVSAVAVIEKGIILPLILALLFMYIAQNPQVRHSMHPMENPVLAASNENQELIVPATGVYYGYYLPQLNSHPETITTGVIQNEKTSLMMYYQDWGDKKGFDSQFMNELSQNNIVPIITWEPWNAQEGQQGDLLQPEYSPKLIASGKYDNFIRSWAQQAAAYKKPYFLRFAHEMNGNWYPWGTKTATPEEYKAMWVHVHDIFEEEGATNTIWVWTPNSTDELGSSDSLMSYYPGDEYVDWVGYSVFNWGDTKTTKWTSFKDLSTTVYCILSQVNKPIMVAETSSVSMNDEKAQWFADVTQDVKTMPQIKAVVFFNENFKQSDFMLSSGMDLHTFIQQNVTSNMYFLKDPMLITRQKDISLAK